ncbi:MAG: MFS transporter [Dehalococcoidia bacterium]|nr:MFS transporter [Dehalococcoidia bacterium]
MPFPQGEHVARTKVQIPWVTPGAKKPFYGWVIVTSGFIDQFITGLAMQGFSSYLGLLGGEFGWSRKALAFPRSLTQAEGALLGPLNGWLVDKFGPRKIMTIGMVILGAGLILFGLIQNQWQYIAVNMFIAIGTSLAGLLVVTVAANNWFRRKRTSAIAIMTFGFSLSGIIGIPLVVLIQTNYGWREALIATGIMVWVLGVPACLLMKSNPESMGLLPDGDQPGETQAGAARRGSSRAGLVDFTFKEALRTKSFWYLCVGNGLNNLVMSAVTVNFFLHVEQGVGLSHNTAAFAFAFMSAVNLGGRMAGGILGDRYSKRLLLALSLAGTAVAVVFLAVAQDIVFVLVFGAIHGFAWGLRTPALNSIMGDYFGRTHYGKILGMLSALATPLSIFGPLVSAAAADGLGNYTLTFLIAAGVGGLSAVMYGVSGPPKLPVRVQAPVARGAPDP